MSLLEYIARSPGYQNCWYNWRLTLLRGKSGGYRNPFTPRFPSKVEGDDKDAILPIKMGGERNHYSWSVLL